MDSTGCLSATGTVVDYVLQSLPQMLSAQTYLAQTIADRINAIDRKGLLSRCGIGLLQPLIFRLMTIISATLCFCDFPMLKSICHGAERSDMSDIEIDAETGVAMVNNTTGEVLWQFDPNQIVFSLADISESWDGGGVQYLRDRDVATWRVSDSSDPIEVSQLDKDGRVTIKGTLNRHKWNRLRHGPSPHASIIDDAFNETLEWEAVIHPSHIGADGKATAAEIALSIGGDTMTSQLNELVSACDDAELPRLKPKLQTKIQPPDGTALTDMRGGGTQVVRNNLVHPHHTTTTVTGEQGIYKRKYRRRWIEPFHKRGFRRYFPTFDYRTWFVELFEPGTTGSPEESYLSIPFTTGRGSDGRIRSVGNRSAGINKMQVNAGGVIFTEFSERLALAVPTDKELLGGGSRDDEDRLGQIGQWMTYVDAEPTELPQNMRTRAPVIIGMQHSSQKGASETEKREFKIKQRQFIEDLNSYLQSLGSSTSDDGMMISDESSVNLNIWRQDGTGVRETSRVIPLFPDGDQSEDPDAEIHPKFKIYTVELGKSETKKWFVTVDSGEQVIWNWKWDVHHRDSPHWDEDFDAWRKANDLPLMIYFNPVLALDTPMYNEALENDYLIKNIDGSLKLSPYPSPSFVIDLYNEEAKEWYIEKIKDLIKESGASGAMVDLGEGESLSGIRLSKDGSLDPFDHHNDYVRIYQEAVVEAIQRSGKQDDFFAFMRSGTIDTASIFPLWLGDQVTLWDESDGLKSVVNGMLNLMTAWPTNPFVHFDIGGWTSYPIYLERSPELLMRWTELSAFSTCMRTHPGLIPSINAQVWDDGVSDHFFRCVGLFEALAPIRDEAIDLARTHYRPFWMSTTLQEADLPTVTSRHSFFVGEDLFVSPVLDPMYSHGAKLRQQLQDLGATLTGSSQAGDQGKSTDPRTTVRVTLPKGEWLHLWDGHGSNADGGVYQDDQVKHVYGDKERITTHLIDAPLGMPPAFIRKDSKHAQPVLKRLEHNMHKLEMYRPTRQGQHMK